MSSTRTFVSGSDIGTAIAAANILSRRKGEKRLCGRMQPGVKRMRPDGAPRLQLPAAFGRPKWCPAIVEPGMQVWSGAQQVHAPAV
jgi:hypothetical protein